MADKDDDTGAPAGAPVCVLDVDDVLCLSDPYGGYDAIEAVRGQRSDAQDVFDKLLHSPAVEVLREVHEALQGHVRFVVSSTWRLHLNRSELASILRRAGLPFVASNMESRERWATPDWSADGRSRLNEIAEWLRVHSRGEAFVVIDDTFSGRSLVRSAADTTSPFYGRVVICDEGVGLLPHHVDRIVTALRATLTLASTR